ncbi:MAG TPA: alpha/beta hydrolase [Candidatus Acidoferrales bacterium]|nr:alpha/beta hydrolase [Candidatus Acidoferrales bacterium]
MSILGGGAGQESSGAGGAASRGRAGGASAWGRRVVTFLAALVTLLMLVIVVGVFIPSTNLVSVIGTIFESFFSLHVFLAGLIAIALAVWARRLGGGRAVTVVLWLAILATIGSTIPTFALVRAAHRAGAPISWTGHLRVTAPGAQAVPDQTKLFATVGGKNLSLDVYLPARVGTGPASASAPVVSIHGGGYSLGERSDGRNWDRWFAARGYTVFDVDYRLDPPVSWNLAAQDVACAMVWIASHASEYNISPDRMLLTGQSAGGGLDLQVGYGLGDGTVKSSCGGTPPQPKAIFALYPPEDFAMGWNRKTGLGSISALTFNTGYLGGSPEQFPERYRAVSAIFHVRPGLPPTLIAAGASDHLVPYDGHIEMVEKLNAAGVPNELVTVPYGEHGYDLLWGSLGGQITRKRVADFLARYLPPTEAR